MFLSSIKRRIFLDEAYQNSVRSLEECRVRWISEMEKAMNSCQQFEEDRISFLRSEMWAYTNLAALQLVSEDKVFAILCL